MTMMDKLRKEVGYYEPVKKSKYPPKSDQSDLEWEVTDNDGGRFTCENQFQVEVLSCLYKILDILKKR